MEILVSLKKSEEGANLSKGTRPKQTTESQKKANPSKETEDFQKQKRLAPDRLENLGRRSKPSTEANGSRDRIPEEKTITARQRLKTQEKKQIARQSLEYLKKARKKEPHLQKEAREFHEKQQSAQGERRDFQKKQLTA